MKRVTTREKAILIWVSQEEKDRLIEAAEHRGLGTSTWLRWLGLQAATESEEQPEARIA